jgi:hypothetical protein
MNVNFKTNVVCDKTMFLRTYDFLSIKTVSFFHVLESSFFFLNVPIVHKNKGNNNSSFDLEPTFLREK